MTRTQGAQANLSGHIVERMMEPVFLGAGFKIYDYKEVTKTQDLLEDTSRYVLRNVPFETIYGSTGRTEFVIVDKDKNRRIRVESKFQSTPGSIDEKYPYMLLNAIYKYPESEIIFVVDGGGYKQGARDWLERCINENWLNFKETGKSLKLQLLSDFVSWFMREF